MQRLSVLGLGAVLAVIVLAAAPAGAHAPAVTAITEPAAPPVVAKLPVDSTHPAWSAAPVPVAAPWELLLVLATAAALAGRRPRQAAGIALVVVLAIFAFETGVHSVHHLGDRDHAQACAVAGAAQHLSGTIDAEVALDGGLVVLGAVPGSGSLPAHSTQPLTLHAGRAPPRLG